MKLPTKIEQAKLLILCQAFLDYEWDRANYFFPDLKRFEKPTITLNNRLRSCGGLSYGSENRIEINTKLLVLFTREFRDIVIPHELMHQADYNLHGASEVKHGHGKNWILLMQKYGQKPDRFLPEHVKL